MLRERAPDTARFIGHSTWISRMGSSPKRRGMRVFTSSMMSGNRGLGILGLDKIKVTFGFGFAEIRDDTLVDAVRVPQ